MSGRGIILLPQAILSAGVYGVGGPDDPIQDWGFKQVSHGWDFVGFACRG